MRIRSEVVCSRRSGCLAIAEVLLVALAGAAPAIARNQQATTPATKDAGGVQLLQKSLLALNGATAVTDVTLSGTAARTVGSDSQTGTAEMKATAVGQSRMDLALSGGNRTEIVDASLQTPQGGWSGPDGANHAMSGHNATATPTWYFPAFILAKALTDADYAVSAPDAETHNGEAVEHISVYQQAAGVPERAAQIMQHLSQVEIYLDSTTLLPAAIAFNTPPDNNLLLDIPVEVRFSNYQKISGAEVAFHVQKYLNRGLILDLQLTNASFNSGLAASTFTIPVAAPSAQ